MNKILALTIFRAAKNNSSGRIGVFLTCSNVKEFERALSDFFDDAREWKKGVFVFDKSIEDKLRGYRFDEILIEGPKENSQEIQNIVVPMISAEFNHVIKKRIFQELGVSINWDSPWENQTVYFSE